MKLSTARRLVCMSYFTVDGLRPLLATATRIVCSGDTKRFLFPDGSVIESTKGNWKVVGMEKNPKLEAAVRRFGNGQKLPVAPFQENDKTLPGKPRPFIDPAQKISAHQMLELERQVIALQELCNEKDEQLDKANRPMVVRLDWWAVALVAVVLVAHYGFGVL